MSALEAAALSGELLQPRSSSPTRSTSTASPINTADELASDAEDEHDGGDSDSEAGATTSKTALVPQPKQYDHEGARTGPKGVIADRKAHIRGETTQRREYVKALNERMAKSAIVGQTWDEEEADRAAEKADEVEVQNWRMKRKEELERFRSERQAGAAAGVTAGKVGLREVGKEGFVHAVERKGWVVVLIYEPDLTRCQTILTSLLSLSLALPSMHLSSPVTLLRARATSLSFSLLPGPPASHPKANHGAENNDEEDEETEEEEERMADPDVLPSLLAYKDGELEKSWIRVDWDVGDDGVEGLLRREGILPVAGKTVYSNYKGAGLDEDE